MTSEAERRDAEFPVLQALVAELRGRLPPLTPRQFSDVGDWMLKALWLGRGEPIAEVLATPHAPARPVLRLVGDGGSDVISTETI